MKERQTERDPKRYRTNLRRIRKRGDEKIEKDAGRRDRKEEGCRKERHREQRRINKRKRRIGKMGDRKEEGRRI